MTVDIIYAVLRSQLHLRTAQQIRTGGKRRRPIFSWAEKIPQKQPFIQLEDPEYTYEELEMEGAGGARWKIKLVHSKSCEEDVQVSGHSSIKNVAQQYLVNEARKHIDELKKAGIKVEGAPKSMWEDAELNGKMLDSIYYVVHQPMTLDDGTKSIMTRYWWDIWSLSV